jgi:lipoprotein-anchoring transpeptidase ErfK/SrfK
VKHEKANQGETAMRRQSEKTFEKLGLVIMIMFWVFALVALSEAARAGELKPATQQQQVAAPQKATQKKNSAIRKASLTAKNPAQAHTQSSDQEQITLTRFVLVSVADRQLALIDNGEVVKLYKVAVGKDSTPSPEGSFSVVKRTENPTYFHEGKVIPPGKDNPVGTRWIGLSMKGYGIHGTNAPRSIGKAASHGCIRMSKKDVEELFTLIKVGDTVVIRNGGDELVAQVFHPETLVANNSDETPSADAGQE